MALETAPDVLVNLAALLALRPTLIGPPKVPAYPVDLGNWTDPEAIVLAQATMVGARFLGWGAGPGSGVTVQPLTLAGYLFTTIAGNDATKAGEALGHAKVLLGEVAQELRDHPDVGGALDSTHRWRQPLITQATWTTAMGLDQQGVSVARVWVDFTINWQALDA